MKQTNKNITEKEYNKLVIQMNDSHEAYIILHFDRLTDCKFIDVIENETENTLVLFDGGYIFDIEDMKHCLNAELNPAILFDYHDYLHAGNDDILFDEYIAKETTVLPLIDNEVTYGFRQTVVEADTSDILTKEQLESMRECRPVVGSIQMPTQASMLTEELNELSQKISSDIDNKVKRLFPSLQAEAFATAVKNEKYIGMPRDLELHAMILAELGEATQDLLKKRSFEYNDDMVIVEGEPVELADVIITILSYAEHKGWNMGEILREKMKRNKIKKSIDRK